MKHSNTSQPPATVDMKVENVDDETKIDNTTSVTTPSTTSVPLKPLTANSIPNSSGTVKGVGPIRNIPPSSTSGRSGMSISLVNVVCNFKLRCHVNLRQVARTSVNAVHKPDKNIVEMELCRPRCTAKIYASGKVFAVGTTTESDALKAARRIARRVQLCGHSQAKFSGFRINNMMTTSWVPFSVRLGEIGELGPPFIFEPELGNRLHVLYKDIRTSVNVAPNGRITIFADSRAKVLEGLKRIYPILYKFRCQPTSSTANTPNAPAAPCKKEPSGMQLVTENTKRDSQTSSVNPSPSLENHSPNINPKPAPVMQQIYQQSISGINFAEAFVARPNPHNLVTPLSLAPRTECFTSPTQSLSLSQLISKEDLTTKKHSCDSMKVDPLSDLDDILDHLQTNNVIHRYGI